MRPAFHRMRPVAAAACAIVLAIGCTDYRESSMPTEPSAARPSANALPSGAAAPPGLVSVTLNGAPQQIWPYTGTDFVNSSDPINLFFLDESDPRSIRAALLALDGNRAGFLPPELLALPFFGCVWRDAIGGDQTSYTQAAGWAGSVIQLECGEYSGFRFHVRLFPAGGMTLGNAHFEIVFPNTHQHQVLSWTLARDFVIADMMRAHVQLGDLFAAPPDVLTDLQSEPWLKTIHPLIYWDPNMVPLHPLINAVVLSPEQIGIRMDGRAGVFRLGRAVPITPGMLRYTESIAFRQLIPKPFCNAGNEYVWVEGPLELSKDVVIAASGNYSSQFKVIGSLSVTPFDPFTGPIGPTGQAQVGSNGTVTLNDRTHSLASNTRQILLLPGAQPQREQIDLQVGPYGLTRHRYDERCGM